jgi:hypothetical protein
MNAPLYSTTTPNTGRGLMACVWEGLLQAYAMNNSGFGYRLSDDFDNDFTDAITGTTTATDSDGWTGQDAVTAGGTYTVSVVSGTGGCGALRLNSDGTTADFGCEAGKTIATVCGPQHASTPCDELAIQFRINNIDADSVLAVLTDAGATTPICGAANAIADVGYVGFQIRNNGDLYFVSKSAAAGTTNAILLIAAANWTPTGEHVFGVRLRASGPCVIGVDGKAYMTASGSINKAGLPTGTLSPRFACTVGNGSTAPTMDVDKMDVFASKAN